MAFQKTGCRCLRGCVRQVQNGEQTQEVRLTDDYPDIGKIIGAWGQCIARGKEWRTESAQFSGGMMVWILYTPEDGSANRVVETWLPFQMKWNLPDGTPEGTLRVTVLPRFVDARTISPRKIMVRGGVGAYGELYAPMDFEVFRLDGAGEDVELLKTRYPIRLPKESGEKTFLLEESLQTDEPVEKIIYSSLKPEISDQKVLSDKIAFRGNGNLHVLYMTPGGMRSQNFLLPFSQFADLTDSHSQDAQATVVPTVTELELEAEGEGLHLKAGITAQYVVDDLVLVDAVEDAYSPGRSLTMERQELQLPAVLEKRSETIRQEQTVPGNGSELIDMSFLPDFPKQFREDGQLHLEMPGTMQLLYTGDGGLQSGNARWEGKLTLPADEAVELRAVPGVPIEPQISFGGDGIQVRTEVPLSLSAIGGKGIPMVTALETGEDAEPDTQRPSLILRRTGDNTLWEIAKLCGSTMEAIRTANNLTDDPTPDRMLLIPVL